jgi:hypothetical protein
MVRGENEEMRYQDFFFRRCANNRRRIVRAITTIIRIAAINMKLLCLFSGCCTCSCCVAPEKPGATQITSDNHRAQKFRCPGLTADPGDVNQI